MSIENFHQARDASPETRRSHKLPRVLVLLATFNGQNWVNEQIDSILSQEGVDLRIEIGDDASTDDTQSLIDSKWGNDPRIHLHAWAKSSGSAGGNFRRLYRLVNAEGFDFVALADQDDIWHPGKILAAIEAMGRTKAEGYSSAVRAFWPDGSAKVITQHSGIRAADFMFEGAGQGCTFVMRPVLFSRVQRFCLDHENVTEQFYYHDWLIYLLARVWNVYWYFDKEPWLQYRQHSNNDTGSRGSIGAITKRLGMIKDGWYRSQLDTALRIFETADGSNVLVKKYAALFRTKDSPTRRFKLFSFFIRHGRRRLIDRLVMATAAIAGWI